VSHRREDTVTSESAATQTATPGRWRRLMRRAVIAAGVCGAIAIVVLTVFLFAVWLWWQRDPSEDQRSRGVNALWAAHTWVSDAHTDAEYRELAALLHEHEISDVFFHAGPLDENGQVPERLVTHAPQLIDAMRRYAPGVRAQAYLGQIEARDGGPLDLDDPAVRANIVETSERFLELGFGGIHYDIEPIYPWDDNFLDLLDRTRERTRPRGAVLSVALEEMEITRLQRVPSWVFGPLFDGYHDPPAAFLRDVAGRVDQIAIMTYDSSLPLESLFGAHMAWQTEHIVKAIGDRVTVFMGVPTYDTGTRGRFFSHAEHIRSGVRGVRKGLDRVEEEKTQDVGIAIFAEWTTTPDEWEAYAESWLPRRE
jgi:hypothetical protein